jgi:hypothetical protein
VIADSGKDFFPQNAKQIGAAASAQTHQRPLREEHRQFIDQLSIIPDEQRGRAIIGVIAQRI